MKRFSFLLAYIVLMAIPSAIFLFFINKSIDFKALILVTLASFLVGGILEIWAVKQGKRDRFYIWEYNPRTTLGKKIMGIAIEDLFVFLVVTPVFIISAWEFVKRIISSNTIPFNTLVFWGVVTVLTSYTIVFGLTKPKRNNK